MTEKKLTIRDIAKLENVSYATVSRALSGSPGISEETRARILKTCNELGYTANILARSLSVRESKLIGLIVGTIDNPYMSKLACDVELQARKRGYNVILCNSSSSSEQEREVFTLLMGRQVDGIIIVPSSGDTYNAISRFLPQMPTVFLGENLRDLRVSYVAVDNFQGTFLGTEHLISLGHRSIVYVGRRPSSNTHQLRGEGYAAACERHGITPVFVDNPLSSSSVAQGYALAKKLFSAKRPYTAVFAATDTTALGVIQAADEAGLQIPRDLSLMGFDNIPFANLPRIRLTTIENPIQIMASTAVDMLTEMAKGDTSGYSHKVLAPSLVQRDTCLDLNVSGSAVEGTA